MPFTCSLCDEAKPAEQMTRQRPKTLCLECHYRRQKRYTEQRARRTMEKIIAYFATHPCVDCGETDWQVLEFDHRDPVTKVESVAKLVRRAAWSKVKKEIEKCDVRCANCHRRKTATDNNWYAYFGNGVARMQ